MERQVRRTRAAAVVVAALALTVACTGGGKETVGKVEGRAAPAGGDLSLKGVCPATIVAQTNWYPQVEHAVFYQLLGDGYTVDKARKRVTGPLVAGGVDTGVKLEIRVGGPALGYQSVPAVMYTDPSITVGLAATDDTVQYSKSQPLLAVMAPLDVDPIVIMWDPKNRPSINTIADIGQTPDMKVLYYEGESTFVDYLISSGILRAGQKAATTGRRPGSSPRTAPSPCRGSPPTSPTSTSTRPAGSTGRCAGSSSATPATPATATPSSSAPATRPGSHPA